MAFDLSKLAKAAAQGVSQNPQLILEIDGVSTLYGVERIKKFVRIGDPGLLIDGSWTIGGFNEVADQDDLISFDGSTTTITQQLLQDKGGASSVSAIQISLLDINEAITRLISPGVVVNELLGRKARVYLGYSDTAFPDDFVTIFSGIIDNIDGGAMITLNVAHPEAGKRFDIFQEGSTKLTAPADFRSLTIQGLTYTTRRDVVGTVSITYNNGGVAGLEVVTVVGTAISVLMQSGVSTASQIRNAIENKLEALSLVSVSIETGMASTVQTAQASTNLESDLTLDVESTASFLTPADNGTLRTYVRIDDEIIEYTGLTDTSFTGCTREAMFAEDPRTQGDQHQTGTEVKSFYRLQGDAFSLALKLMLSGDEYFLTDEKITSIQVTPDNGVIANAIYFQGIIAGDRFGLVPGDFCTITGDQESANNFTLRTITEVVSVDGGSYIVVDGAPLVTNSNPSGVIAFKSKYNVLPLGAGLNLGGDQVDVPEFERLRDLFFSAIFTYDFYLTSTEKGKDFIDTDLLFPTGAYSIPRKGKISVGFTSPPLSIAILPVLDSDNTVQPQTNKIVRTINRYFYNNVVFKYNQNVLDNSRYLSGKITVDADSKLQIKVGNKSLTVLARGLRPSSDNDVIISQISNRMLERYRFAAEITKAKFLYGEAFYIDVGDAVVYGDQQLNLIDTRRGVRGFDKRIFEVVNKSLDIKTGAVVLDLLDTHYLNEGRYGVFGPASNTGVGSTTSVLKLKASYGTSSALSEKLKWQGYIGEKIAVRSEDWSVYAETTLMGFDPSDNNKIIVGPALGFTPPEDYIIEPPIYPGLDLGAAYKNQHCFFDPTISVVAGTSQTVFDVGAGDIAKLFVGATLMLRLEDWTQVSPEVKISGIAGNTVTVDKSLGFIPTSSHLIDFVGFSDDAGSAYRFI